MANKQFTFEIKNEALFCIKMIDEDKFVVFPTFKLAKLVHGYFQFESINTLNEINKVDCIDEQMIGAAKVFAIEAGYKSSQWIL